jgi:hypothetical protein
MKYKVELSILSCVLIKILHGDFELLLADEAVVVQVELLHYLSIERLLAAPKRIHQFLLRQHAIPILINHFKGFFE